MYQGASLADRAIAIVLVSSLVAGGIAFARQSNFDLARLVARQPAIEATAKAPVRIAAGAGSALEPAHRSIDKPNSRAPVPAGDKQETDSDVLLVEDPPWDPQPADKYITFVTRYSEQVVRNFELRCPHSGKTIRLIDSMRVGLRQIALMGGGHLHMTVDSRGDEVRIYNQMRLNDGRSNERRVSMSIDQWGELHTYGIIPSSIYAACY